MNNISTIRINGQEYEIVDKASRQLLEKMNEPYLPFPSIKQDEIESQNISTTITSDFEIMDYPYFFFTSTNKDRVLYTKAGNMVLQNKVFLTSYLSNYIDSIDEGEVITIYYGN